MEVSPGRIDLGMYIQCMARQGLSTSLAAEQEHGHVG